MAIEYNFTLDMDRSKRDNNIAYARTGDVDSITINADLVFNGAAYTPTGTNAFFECITPNGHSIRAAASKTGSTVSVEVPSAAFQAAGVINVAYFRFESGEADNPAYVESTEPFAIVVREGIGDNIDAGDYIEEWRKLADQLEAVVAEVEQKAEKAEAAINEQKTEVDQLKAQAQVSIAGDVTEVEEAAQSAIAAINKEKADVADAAEDVSAAGEQAINTFKTNSQQAISKFNTDGTSAINQFNTKADGKLDEVDGMITEAQGDVDAAITQLENKTQDAIDAAQDALDGTTATNLQNAINRTLKLDIADMTNIPSNSSLSSFTNVGSYCCKTAAVAATVGDCPVDDGPFNMYVFSSSTSGQVMQLVVPIDLNGKPTAEWHVRFGTSSAMDPWSVIGGGADISAGLGIDVTGDAKKTVSLDTTAFYQHHEAAEVIQGSTEVTGGGRIKELTVYGNTRQNLWRNNTTSHNGVSSTANSDGSLTISGTASGTAGLMFGRIYTLRPGTVYTVSVDKKLADSYGNGSASGACFYVSFRDADGAYVFDVTFGFGTKLVSLVTVPTNAAYAELRSNVASGFTVSGTYRVMLNEGSEPELWCPPGLNGVDELSVVTAGKNLFPFDNDRTNSGITFEKVDGGGVHVYGTATGIAQYTVLMMHRFPRGTYTISGGKTAYAMVWRYDANGAYLGPISSSTGHPVASFNVSNNGTDTVTLLIQVNSGVTVDEVIYPQLELGSTATAYEPPAVTTTPIDLDGHALNSLPDGTRDELRIDGTGNVTLVQNVGISKFDGDENWMFTPNRIGLNNGAPGCREYVRTNGFCDTIPTVGIGDSSCAINAYASGWVDIRNESVITSTETGKAWLAANPTTYLYPLSSPKTTDLGTVSMPDLASPSYVIYASSDVPAEIEAEVVKVDYLHPADVYTKEEVDHKIDDAGMPAVVPVSRGGTGVTTAAAERNRLGLGNTTGALPVANGGTGAANTKAAQYNLLNDAIQRSTNENVNDETNFALFTVSANTTNGAVQKLPALNIWNYILGKIRSTFGFNSSNVLTVAKGGTGSMSSKAAQNSLLNDMNVSSDALTDSSMLVGYNASPSASNGAVHKRSVSTVWDYIAGKVADKVWEQIKTKAVRSDITTGADLTLVGGLESTSQIRTSTLTLGVNEMSLVNSNAAPLTVNGKEVITESNISSYLPATFDAKSVRFSTPLKQGQQKNIITEGGFTLEELRKYFVPGNLVLANMVCGGDRGQQLNKVVPMVINIGDGMIMVSAGITYDSLAEAHYDCIFGVVNNEQAGGDGGTGLADGVTMLHSVTESPSYADRTSTSSLRGFTVFDLVSHSI